MELKELDVVRLTDGRLATVVFLPSDNYHTDTLEVDLESPYDDDGTVSIHRSQIKDVVYSMPV
jgi:hypothetical protein